MKKILVIEASPNGESSVSKKGTKLLLNKLGLVHTNVEIKTRDLNLNPIPHLTGEAIQAFFTPPENRTDALKSAIVLSDLLTDELLWADEIVLSVPMWNFGVPSVVKAWIDHVSRAGRTFSFTESGLVGLAAGRRVHLVVASGSVFSSGNFAAFDMLVPYVKTFFGFIGITDVNVFRIEGVNDPSAKDLAFKKVEEQISALV